MNRIQGRLVAVFASAMLATLMLAGSAGAANLGGGTGALVPRISYTTAQLQALQAEVDAHLNDYGPGKQIGINQIAFDGGNTVLTFPLPGETKARAVDEPITPLGVPNCRFAYACIWSDTNFNGSRAERTKCETITLAAPWNSSTASVHNNQTTNTQTVLLNASRHILLANLAPSKVNDTGVLNRSQARFWKVC